MSAETLRRAAALMRERAEAATPGPWAPAIGDPHFFRQPSVKAPEQGHDEEWVAECKDTPFHGRADAEHIAGMQPPVALAVSRLLDRVADDYGIAQHGYWSAVAEDIARAYLGEQP